MSEKVLIVSALYAMTMLLFSVEINYIRAIYVWGFTRSFYIIQNRERQPKIGLARRIIGDIARWYLSTVVKAVSLGNFEIYRVLRTFPQFFWIMFIWYMIGHKTFKRYYTDNVIGKTLINLEFRYFKSIQYLRYTWTVTDKHHCLLFSWAMSDLAEGLSTSSVNIVEEFIFSEKLDTAGWWRNLKIYLQLNLVSIVFFLFEYQYYSETIKSTVYYPHGVWDHLVICIILQNTISSLSKNFKDHSPEKAMRHTIANWIERIKNTLERLANFMMTSGTARLAFRILRYSLLIALI